MNPTYVSFKCAHGISDLPELDEKIKTILSGLEITEETTKTFRQSLKPIEMAFSVFLRSQMLESRNKNLSVMCINISAEQKQKFFKEFPLDAKETIDLAKIVTSIYQKTKVLIDKQLKEPKAIQAQQEAYDSIPKINAHPLVQASNSRAITRAQMELLVHLNEDLIKQTTSFFKQGLYGHLFTRKEVELLIAGLAPSIQEGDKEYYCILEYYKFFIYEMAYLVFISERINAAASGEKDHIYLGVSEKLHKDFIEWLSKSFGKKDFSAAEIKLTQLVRSIHDQVKQVSAKIIHKLGNIQSALREKALLEEAESQTKVYHSQGRLGAVLTKAQVHSLIDYLYRCSQEFLKQKK